MTDISAFRNAVNTGTTGCLSACGAAVAPLTVIIGGRAALALRDPGETANRQLKNEFLAAVRETYGRDFAGVAANALTGSGPLSRREVAIILQSGERVLARQRREQPELVM